MYKLSRLKSLALLVAALAAIAQAQLPATSAVAASGNNSSRFLPLSDIKEGMHGVARTVFRGSTAEEFNVEILGVLPGAIGPQQDLIIGRLSGGPAERTSVFAGMSGSPVYIDGRLVGAISYSFPFSKEPICGITPIEQMVAIFEKNQPVKASSGEPRAMSFAQLASAVWSPERLAPLSASSLSGNSKLAAVTGGSLQPIATPLTFSGISQTVLDQFAPQLMDAGLLPVASAGGAAAVTPMKTADPNTLVGGDVRFDGARTGRLQHCRVGDRDISRRKQDLRIWPSVSSPGNFGPANVRIACGNRDTEPE